MVATVSGDVEAVVGDDFTRAKLAELGAGVPELYVAWELRVADFAAAFVEEVNMLAILDMTVLETTGL